MSNGDSELYGSSRELTLAFLILLAFSVIGASSSLAQSFTVLHNFPTGGQDGSSPSRGTLLLDAQGNLYGTTWFGGSAGLGTIYELSPSPSGWTERLLYFFDPGPGGGILAPWYPSSLIMDPDGNLYGTTLFGGAHSFGTLFELTPSGAASALYAFTGGTDGGSPADQFLTMDGPGNLYGVTQSGGAYGHGTVFVLTPTGTEHVLYSFTGGADGGQPQGDLLRDSQGNLWGTTAQGGLMSRCRGAGCGTVFKIAGDGMETVFHAFGGAKRDGALPNAGLVADAQGNLYGTTYNGGTYNLGTVFQLTPDGVETVLHSFAGGSRGDGAKPFSNLVRDGEGNLYGITVGGKGRVFEIAASGTERVIYSFNNKSGYQPPAGLVLDAAGNLYGTTSLGGASGKGTVFQLRP